MLKNKLYELTYDLKEAIKNRSTQLLFIVVSIILFSIIRVFCSSTRVYIHIASRKFFRINAINGLWGFIFDIFKDNDKRIIVKVTNIEDGSECPQDLDLHDFINNYAEFKIATENDRLFYGPK